MMKAQTSNADQPQMVPTSENFWFRGNDFSEKRWKKFLLSDPYIGPIGNFVLIFLSIFFLSTLALAGEWRFVPKIGLYAGYDDNVFFSREDKISSSVINIRACL